MGERHPDELDLLAYVEEELSSDARREVSEHLVACRTCSDHVRRLEAARTALRAAAPLELSEEGHEKILAALPARQPPKRSWTPLRRILVVAAPVAAAAALVGGFVAVGTLGGGENDEGEAAGVAAEEGAADMGGAEAPSVAREGATTMPGGSAQALNDAHLVRDVLGPPGEIVVVLSNAGITAAIQEGAVVADASTDAVRTALAGRPDGTVPVYVGKVTP
jgi:anti-sigma factor RsiW